MKSLGLVALFVAGSLSFGFCSDVDASDLCQSTLIAQAADTEAAGTGEVSTDAPHLATPAASEGEGEKYSGFRQFLEDQQNAHDKLIVDRFLLGVAVIFACIAAALLFSLPPKPREQKE
ncbi:hypothetical protein KF707_13320 [Candidatus Obscuribacterales bacterium]|nr:hypothetical protein [Candidatus Obscuribacterales bacterium]MBX3152495.1 hypothetical protein [Candidatus Obscuribacterales bacterium]